MVIIVITPTIGSKNELVAPTSEPPFAVTRASSPPDDDNPNPALSEVDLLKRCILVEAHTVRNLAEEETSTNTIAGSMNNGINEMSISAPTEMKNNAANMSRIGVDITLVTRRILDSAINTPAKNAPVATEIPSLKAITDKPKATPRTAMINNS